jgi:hypothetical protein
MAFTSETVLKFGNSPVSFTVITLLSYSLNNEKAGAFDYRRKETISLDGLFSNRESSVPIAEHFRQVKLLLETSTDFVEIKLNDQPYGKARFLGFSFPTSVNFDENAVRFSKVNIQLEVIKDDSSGTFANANLPSSVSGLTNIWYKLKNFTEAFSFRLAEENTFTASHEISFGFDNIDKNSDSEVVALANQVANTFFAQGLDALSSIRPFYSSTDFQISALDYGSSLKNQSIDLINYQFSFTKEYAVLSSNQSTASETIITEINYGDNGIFEVVEKGRIKGKGNNYPTARANAIARLDVNLNNAYARCNSAFGRYLTDNIGNFSTFFPKYNSSDALKSQAVSITKDLSEFGPEIGYEIRFTTDNSYSATRIHSYTVTLRKNIQGLYDAVVNGSIKYYTNKNKAFNSNLSDIKSVFTASDLSLINVYYPKIAGSGTFSGIKTTSSLNHLKFGVETTYSKTYSDFKGLVAEGSIIRQVSIASNISVPNNKYSTVIVPGFDNPKSIGKEQIYQTRQLTQGGKNISIEMKVDRNALYSSGTAVNTNVNTVFSTLETLLVDNIINSSTGSLKNYSIVAFNRLFKEISIDKNYLTWFLDNIKISFDSSYTVRADLEFKFFANKEQI